MAKELSGRQQFELAMLCDDVERAGSDATPALTELVRYVHRERIGPEDFTDRDHAALIQAHTAAVMAVNPTDFVDGSAGYRILLAAGVLIEIQF
ncbi:unnamed protein product [Gemmataceae bacterium]|nr:unnamed protein product [Gemmataceae bacterium]VTT99012.1 unnamed protein product [Gemmataceae bacterium]